MHSWDVFQIAGYVKFYEWCWGTYDEDIPFYLVQAAAFGSPVLEVACGTGRVTMPLAREGFEVTGIDLSRYMLDLAREKLTREPEDVARRVRLVQGDMRKFDLGEQFAAVFVPNAALFHLQDDAALRHCFACLHKHVKPGGVAIIDLVSPARMAGQQVGRDAPSRSGVNPVTGCVTTEMNERLEVDLEARRVRVRHVFTEQDGDGEKQYEFTQDYRWLERDEGEAMLREAGFARVDALGSYDGTPYDEERAPRLILIAYEDGA